MKTKYALALFAGMALISYNAPAAADEQQFEDLDARRAWADDAWNVIRTHRDVLSSYAAVAVGLCGEDAATGTCGKERDERVHEAAEAVRQWKAKMVEEEHFIHHCSFHDKANADWGARLVACRYLQKAADGMAAVVHGIAVGRKIDVRTGYCDPSGRLTEPKVPKSASFETDSVDDLKTKLVAKAGTGSCTLGSCSTHSFRTLSVVGKK